MPDGSFGTLMPAPQNRDDEIIAYCAAILRLRQVSEELFHDPDPGSPAERALNKTWVQLEEQQRRMVNHMCKLKATTMQAHRMRALLLGAWIPDGVEPGWEEDGCAMAIVGALVHDLISSSD